MIFGKWDDRGSTRGEQRQAASAAAVPIAEPKKQAVAAEQTAEH
jgi:hypothetical protein